MIKKTKIGYFSKSKKSKKTKYASSRNEYPFYKLSYKLNPIKIKLIAKNLQSQLNIYKSTPYKLYPSYKHKILPFIKNSNKPSEYYIIKSSWNDNLELNSLTDYFTEPCRVLCKFKSSKSPLEYWNIHHLDIISKLKNKNIPITSHNLREEMYFRNKPCNNFRISVCLEVLRLFNPKSWLDISAGWGDRLLSALLFPSLEIYTACDPNSCLHPYYREMCNTFNFDNKKKITLIQDGFENALLPKNQKYDLVFSSPPFFDLEVYSQDKADSLIKYNTSEKWFNGFLMPSIYKSIEYLSVNGFLVLYMGESHGTKYIPEMVNLTNKISGVRNAGMFYYTDGNKLREFYCWQKNK